MDLEFEAVAERAPVRVRFEARRTPDGVEKFWSECDGDVALDAIVGASAEQAIERVLERIDAPLGKPDAKA
jgi:hypothetical protein